METLELINPELYQILVHRAASNVKWAEYFLLVNACCEIIKRIPRTSQACEQVEIENLLLKAMENRTLRWC